LTDELSIMAGPPPAAGLAPKITKSGCRTSSLRRRTIQAATPGPGPRGGDGGRHRVPPDLRSRWSVQRSGVCAS